MNKIEIENGKLKFKSINNEIDFNYIELNDLFQIFEYELNIKSDTALTIKINLNMEARFLININLLENISLNLNIISIGNKGKIQYKYNLKANSKCNVSKFQNVDNIREMVMINLNGENSDIEYNFKNIAKGFEKYDYFVYHNSINSISNIKNNGVCIENGKMAYQVSSYVPKDVTGCICNQSNRIINLTENECSIKPNLYIDCNDVSANHSALVGNFSKDELFYLQSRGLNKNDAIKLLLSGFLTSDITCRELIDEIRKAIELYWR